MGRTAVAAVRVERVRGFTLIEVLVVIAVVGLLAGLLVPALASSRRLARQAREVAAGQSLAHAYLLYAHDHRDEVLPGYVPSGWVSAAPAPGSPSVEVRDGDGQRVTGVAAQRYPWRIAPYLDFQFGGLYKDERLLTRYRERSDFQYVASLSPSYGLNSALVGGDAQRYGFNAAALRNWGPFYLTRLDQARSASELLVFATARGVDPDGGESVPGYFRVDPPNLLARQWGETLDRALDPATTGHVDFRHDSRDSGAGAGAGGGAGGTGGKAAAVMLDGHARTFGFAALEDMRRWSHRADVSGWTISP